MELLDSFIFITLIKAAVIFAVLMTTLAYLQWVERKVIAHIQVRPGPYRVGPHGLLQPLADVIKLLTKEDLIPPYVNKLLYLLAPFLAITMALLSISVIPFGPTIHGRPGDHLDAADRSQHRRALHPGRVLDGRLRHRARRVGVEQQVRAARRPAQFGADDQLRTADVAGHRRAAVDLQHPQPARTGGAQAGGIFNWNILHGPFPQIISFIIFMIAAFAETNRVPFDLPEAENELVAGFHTEYSSMKFASFFMAEYANMITVSAMATLLFLGGWMAPWPAAYGSSLVPTVIFAIAGADRCSITASTPCASATSSPSRSSA